MTQVIVTNKVKDYDSWRQFFDSHKDQRKEAGERFTKIFRSDDNPNEVLIYMGYEDEERAWQYASSSELRQAMKESGLTEPPELLVFKDTDWQPHPAFKG